MNATDYKHLKGEIEKAESYVKFYEGLQEKPQEIYKDYSNDIYFWKGYLNAVNLLWLQAKNNYKI